MPPTDVSPATGSPSAPRHLQHWPARLPKHLTVPQTSLWHNVEVSAARFADKPFILFYDTPVSFAAFKAEAERIAGYLQQVCGVQRGDRVLIDLQNCPQSVLAYYGILRADAVVVPVNPMNRCDELRHYLADSGAKVALVAQDLLAEMLPLLRGWGEGAATGADDRPAEPGQLDHLIVACYSDWLRAPTDLPVPAFVSATRQALPVQPVHEGQASQTTPGTLITWADMIARDLHPGPLTTGPDDLCVMPYTSGTTGQPKGCMHLHRNAMASLVGGVQWFGRTQDAVYLSVLPFFHVTGMAGSMNGPLFAGATIVLLPRWDREAAAVCIQRYRVTTWQAIAAMVVDFLAMPGVENFDLSSLEVIRGGGAAMPAAVAGKLKTLTGLDYVEGYGMSETMAATHLNPPDRAKPQCLGIPMFDVDARLLDPATMTLIDTPGVVGEVIVRGPQVMQGYWGQAQGSEQAFIELEVGGGNSAEPKAMQRHRYLRTGDLAQIDDDGYFFMVDRLKRMINAAGFKVWPAEVESLMYHHPAVLEACVIGARDAKRGETVKALVVLRDGVAGSGGVTEDALIAWCRERMAAYKVPRIIAFVPSLPKSGTGKIQWRELQVQQDREDGV